MVDDPGAVDDLGPRLTEAPRERGHRGAGRRPAPVLERHPALQQAALAQFRRHHAQTVRIVERGPLVDQYAVGERAANGRSQDVGVGTRFG